MKKQKPKDKLLPFEVEFNKTNPYGVKVVVKRKIKKDISYEHGWEQGFKDGVAYCRARGKK